MSWYRTGTVTVTNASDAVTGAGTAWLGVVRPGWGFVGPDGRVYEVLDVTADGALTLARVYAGSSVSGALYDAFPTQGEIAALADGVSSLIADYASVRDAAGAGKFSAGSAALPGLAATGDTNTGHFWPAADTVGISTGGAERVRVTSAGNVGIGTTGPSYPLDVNGAMRATAFRNSLGNVVFSPGNASQPTKIGAGDPSSFTSFHKSGTMTTGDEAMRIDATGQVGIGTITPAAKLNVADAAGPEIRLTSTDTSLGTGDVIGTVSFAASDSSTGSSGVLAKIDAVANDTFDAQTTDGLALRFFTGTTNPVTLAERVRIAASGFVGIGTATPATPLDINHATDSRVRLMLAGVGVMQMQAVAGANRLASSNTDPLEFWTNGVRRVLIDSNGNHIKLAQATPPALTVNNQMVMNLTTNTNLRISVRGSDGVTRVANITLA